MECVSKISVFCAPEFVLLYFTCHCEKDGEVLVLLGGLTSRVPLVGVTQGKHGTLRVLSCLLVEAGLFSSSPLADHSVDEEG